MKGPLAGVRAWLVQRISAVYLLGFVVFLVARIPTLRWTYASWRDFALAPSMRVGLLLFFVALLLHIWVGLRDVVLDYVRPAVLRTVVLAGIGVGEAAIAAWVAVTVFPM